MSPVRRALIWAHILTISCALATPSYAQDRRPTPKRVPKACKIWSEALNAEIEKSATCERSKAQEVAQAINATRGEGRKAIKAAQAQLHTTDGALQEARRKAREDEKAHAQAIFDFSARNLEVGRKLGVSEAKRKAQPNPVVVAGVTAVVVVVVWEASKWFLSQALGGS